MITDSTLRKVTTTKKPFKDKRILRKYTICIIHHYRRQAVKESLHVCGASGARTNSTEDEREGEVKGEMPTSLTATEPRRFIATAVETAESRSLEGPPATGPGSGFFRMLLSLGRGMEKLPFPSRLLRLDSDEPPVLSRHT